MKYFHLSNTVLLATTLVACATNPGAGNPPPAATEISIKEKPLSLVRYEFLELQAFYGFEGSFPEILSREQYPQHAVLEKEIETRTGKKLSDAIQLTAAERQALLQREDPSALYVLNRLEPATAKNQFILRLRAQSTATPAQRCEARWALVKTFQKEFKKAELKKIFGTPDRLKKKTAYYNCGEDIWPDTLAITEGAKGFTARMPLQPE